MSKDRSVSGIIFGPSKTGKSYLLATAPRPLLFVDVEGQTRFIPGNRDWIQWFPGTPCPKFNETDCVRFRVRNFSEFAQVKQLLMMPSHGFTSVVVDSVTETQERNTDALAGSSGVLRIQDWGTTLRDMSSFVRGVRDILDMPDNPLRFAFFSAMEGDSKGKSIPHVQGQLRVKLPYWLDIVGYYVSSLNEDQVRVRRLHCQPSPFGQFDAGDRTGMLGEYVDNPTLPMLINMIYGPE